MSTAYSGWTGDGTGALLKLQCYVKMNALPMQVVEPAVENSKFHVIVDKRKLRFSDLFDMSPYNRLLKQERQYAILTLWNNFVQTAPQTIVYPSERLLKDIRQYEKCSRTLKHL